jgi:hypothetical protein
MPNGEVLKAYSYCDLIVDDSITDCAENSANNDHCSLHLPLTISNGAKRAWISRQEDRVTGQNWFRNAALETSLWNEVKKRHLSTAYRKARCRAMPTQNRAA